MRSLGVALAVAIAVVSSVSALAEPAPAARPTPIELDPSDPDVGLFVARHSGGAADGAVAGLPTSCKTIGAYEIAFAGSFHYRGNAFRFDVDTRVLEIGMMLAFPSGTTSIQFSVHRLEDDGVYRSVLTEDLIRTVAGTGSPTLYTTGPLAEPLLLPGGFEYLIAATWGAQEIDFARGNLSYPQPFSTGSVLGRVGINGVGVPIGDELSFVPFSTAGAYAMELCLQPERGACCADGFCLEVFENDCTAPGSFFHGERVGCDEVACSFGACCTSCGDCEPGYTPQGCDAERGVNHWPGVSCVEPLCPVVTGACCNGSRCTETCEDECTGTYRGDGTACEPNICAGACCLDQGCADTVTPGGCDIAQGAYQGDGTQCARLAPDVGCTVGACCFRLLPNSPPSCNDAVDRDECSVELGLTGAVYVGDGSTCTSGCPNDADVGACCLPDGACINTTQDYCTAPWVVGQYNAASRCQDGGVCSPRPCCFDGSCENLMVPACTAFGGVPAVAPSCSGDPCRTVARGACCGGDAGDCDEVSRLACEQQDGYFQGVGSTCGVATTTCPGFGACCRPGGDCIDGVTQADCVLFTGSAARYQGDGVACGDPGVACDQRRACCAPTGACLIALPADCTSIGGRVVDTSFSCVDQPCAKRGACCLNDECTVELESDCDAFGGAYRGDDTTCTGTLCIAGACCHLDGRCDEGLVLFECSAVQDELAPGFTCDDIECIGRGACCTGDTCLSAVTLQECLDAEGIFDGEGSLCRTGLCAVGACCDRTVNEGCAPKTRQQCESEGGAHLGAGTDCASSQCAVGSCCGVDGACDDLVVPSQCIEPAQFRANQTCGQSCNGRGACCVLDDPQCQLLEREECVLIEDARYAGDAELCAPDLCVPGACCLPDGSCEPLSRLTCERAGGGYQGAESTCGQDVCGATGACCNRISGACADIVVEAACAFDWTEGVDCDTLDPPCVPAPTGACCDRISGTCVDDVLETLCDDDWIDGTSCDALDPPCMAAGATLIDSDPTGSMPGEAPAGDLWRFANNVVRLTFDADIVAPAAGEVEIVELLAGPSYGPDLSGSFTFTVENEGGGDPRILKIQAGGAVLSHRSWYAFRNTGAWTGVSTFEVQYPVQVGDATGDLRVLFNDLGTINGSIPCFTGCDLRLDINGDGRVLFNDLGVANANVPSFPVAKPAGH